MTGALLDLLIFFFIFILFYSTTNKTRCIQRLERNKFKKTVNPYKPSTFLLVFVHSKDPDQTPQSEESDHGLH